MANFQEDRSIYLYARYSFIYDCKFEKYVNEEGMPDFRKYGLSPYVIREYIDKVLKHENKWAFDGDGLKGIVFKWCLYIGWIVCGGFGALMESMWGVLLGFILLIGVYYLVCSILNYIKVKERNAINSQLIENYLQEYNEWIKENYPHL